MMGRIIFCLVVSIILGQEVTGQVDFKCHVDSNQMLIGDQRILWLEASASTDFQPDTVSFDHWSELGFAALQKQSWQPAGAGAFRQKVIFAVFDTGYIKLPPLQLPYGINGTTDTVLSNQLSLEVNAITVDSTGLAPIKPILREPLTFRDFVPYIIAVAVGILLIGFIFLRRKSEEAEPKVVEVPSPAHEIALIALKTLKEKKLWQQGEIKRYQSELTHIIREYLEKRFQIPALESTTGEILRELSQEDIDNELITDLDQILNMADLIKFAKAEPEVNIHTVFMEKAEHFVRSTKEEETVIVDNSDD